ncbi:GtrA family protein [Agathobacter ruminis]|uniref:GtrA family protein n=2 Tax=Agathobacter ruminis TaxID=1712665 RepID=A0A2G3E0J3_9FIRM|nr:GtrA family protein [Agathobacter ruminis]
MEENMRKIKRLIYQIARFSAVGVTCFAVDYGLLIILTEFTSLEYFNSSAISFILSTLLNYVLSMRFVFRGKEGMNRWAEMGIFIALSLIGLGLNQMIMWIVVEQMMVYYLFAKILASIIVSVFNFISRKVFLE